MPASATSDAEVFSSVAIPGRPQWHIGRSSTGLPAVLVAVENPLSAERLLTVGLENLRIEHNIRCQLTRSGSKPVMSRYSILQCLSDDSEVQACFLRTIAGVVAGFGGRVEARDLTELVNRLIALFRLVRQPRAQAIRGLWGELFVLLSSRDCAQMVNAWHSNPIERFDFSSGDQRIEVKSSSTRSRDHLFSIEQVYPPSGASVLVASVHVEEQVNGTTLGELWDRASDAAADAVGRLKIERVCVESLGEDLAVGRASAFDADLAADSLAFFAVQDIPRLSPTVPMGVSQVQFRSDLSLVTPASTQVLRAAGGMHRNVLQGE